MVKRVKLVPQLQTRKAFNRIKLSKSCKLPFSYGQSIIRYGKSLASKINSVKTVSLVGK